MKNPKPCGNHVGTWEPSKRTTSPGSARSARSIPTKHSPWTPFSTGLGAGDVTSGAGVGGRSPDVHPPAKTAASRAMRHLRNIPSIIPHQVSRMTGESSLGAGSHGTRQKLTGADEDAEALTQVASSHRWHSQSGLGIDQTCPSRWRSRGRFPPESTSSMRATCEAG